ncbi:MAG: hypothetical protein V8S32_03140 [Lachnospiraceae bacterium]
MKWGVNNLRATLTMYRWHWILPIRIVIEAGISVYNPARGKPIVNSADAAGREEYVDRGAANDAIVIALCNGRRHRC